MRFLLSLVMVLPQLYIIFTSIMFCVAGFAVASLFNQLCQEVKQLTPLPLHNFANRLERCQNLHVLNRNLLHQLNGCFNNVLLLMISFSFISIVNGIYGFVHYSYMLYIPYIVYPLLQMTLICYVCHRIQTEVTIRKLIHYTLSREKCIFDFIHRQGLFLSSL